MITKFNIGDKAIFLDFNDFCMKVGYIVNINITTLKAHRTELGKIIFDIDTIYGIDYNGTIHHFKECDIFKSKDECKAHLIEKFGL